MSEADGPIAVPCTRPLVFVGPSASHDDVRALLPEAEIRGPVQRGDLYTARILRYSVFIVIDGVFTQSQAISPREVVDVVDDGAVFLGASSMGALRATDCGPAGAQGVGAVWRLFRRGIVSSEDDVAVLFLPERPFPALTLALVNARFALRRMVRAGALSAETAHHLISVATDMHYADRTWPAIFKTAEVALPPSLKAMLDAQDVKRDDARAVLKHAARCLKRDPNWTQQPRRSRSTFSILDAGREHAIDPLLGSDAETTAPGFLVWMLGSGRAPAELRSAGIPLLSLNPEIDWSQNLAKVVWADIGQDQNALQNLYAELIQYLDKAGKREAEHLRHLAVAKAAAAQAKMCHVPDDNCVIAAADTISVYHGVVDWKEIRLEYVPDTPTVHNKMRDCLAHAKAWQRTKTRGTTK